MSSRQYSQRVNSIFRSPPGRKTETRTSPSRYSCWRIWAQDNLPTRFFEEAFGRVTGGEMLVEIFPDNYPRRIHGIGSGERDAVEHLGVRLRRIDQGVQDAKARNDRGVAV